MGKTSTLKGNNKSPAKLFRIIKNTSIVIFGFSIIVLFFFGIGQWISWHKRIENEEIRKRQTSTIGRIVKGNRYRKLVAEYYVNNKRYESESGPWGIYEGEYFLVYFKSEHPIESFVDYAHPMFLKEQVTATTSARIVAIDNSKAKFSYSVEGIVYTRIQMIEEETEFQENKIYRVTYLVSNPEIAALE